MRPVAADAANGGGQVTAAGVTARTNLCANPSFEGAFTSGLAANWAFSSSSSVTGTVVPTQVAAIGTGSSAQRIQYTGVAGDSAGDKVLLFSTSDSAVGSCAPGDVLTVSALLKGALSGCQLAFAVVWRNSSGGYISQAYSADPAVTGTATRFSATISAAPANASLMALRFYGYAFGTGDTIDLTIDDVLIEKAASLGDYFDGATLGYWTGAANASTSVFDGITARGVCWNTAGTPTVADSKTDDHIHSGTNVSAFTSALTGLVPSATYHARAYAVNADGTSYGDEVDFTTGHYGGRRTPRYIGGGVLVG